jgi:hypothetical protein
MTCESNSPVTLLSELALNSTLKTVGYLILGWPSTIIQVVLRPLHETGTFWLAVLLEFCKIDK